MALDPRISLGVQPVQLSNPLDQYSKIAALQQAQNQNALAQYQLGAAQRADEQAQNRLRLFQEAGGDPGKVANALLRSGDWEGYTKLTKGEAETGDLRAKTIAKHMELSKERLSSVRTPEDYLAWHQANHADPVLAAYFQPMGITSESQTPKIIEQLGQPGGFEALFKQSALGLDKAMEQVLTPQSFGGTNRVISTPKYALPGTTPTAEVVQGSVGKVTMTEAERAADARARQRMAFDIGQAAPAAVEAKAAAQARGQASVEGGKPLTESQSKAAKFSILMDNAFQASDQLEKSVGVGGKLLAGSSFTNFMAPEKAQQYEQAKRNWVAANLRQESGAVIGENEMAAELKRYFPVAGDGPKQVEQKRQARLDAMAGMEAMAGEGGVKAVKKSRQALGERYQRKASGDGVDTSNPLLK